MFISTEDLDWQSELDYANRAFAAMVGGQRFENITRAEAKRLTGQQRKSPAPVGVGTHKRGATLGPISFGGIEARGGKL
jgi:hypothetical protein